MVHKNGLHYRPVQSIEKEEWYERLKENNGRNTWFSFQSDSTHQKTRLCRLQDILPIVMIIKIKLVRWYFLWIQAV